MTFVDRILYNGDIITQDTQLPRVSAVAIHHGQIVTLGRDDDILALAGTGTIRENLNGKTVIPGLTDAHIHWAWTSRTLHEVNVFEVPEKQIALERVAARVATTAEGQWITGNGWVQDLWVDPRFPTAADLDVVAPAHPVYLRGKSGHAGWANSMALRVCGISAATPDPEGGKLVRDATGNPTGVLLESAMELVAAHIPKPTSDQLATMMLQAQQQALAVGLTGIHDFDGPDCLAALQILRERGDLALRVLKNINAEWIDHAHALGLRWGFGDAWIRIGGVKIFADGALGPRTALMIAPYDGEPENYGIRVVDKEAMIEIVSKASAFGLPATIHAIGDRAVHDVLDVYAIVREQEAARGEARSSRRHRIEHVQIIHPDDVNRLAELDIIASMQPIHAVSDYLTADRYWGARSRFAYNPRLQLERGVVVAFGSDSPVEPFDPRIGIHAAVTRQRADGSPSPEGWYPEARLSVAEALHGFTIGAAYTAGLERQLGRLAPGYLADLVLLDVDPFVIAPAELRTMPVLATMVGGEWRYGGVE